MIDRCRICGSNAGGFLVEKKSNTFESTWVLCENCGSAHIDPYPSQELLAKYYNSGYLEMGPSSAEQTTAVSHRVRFSDQYRAQVFSEYGYSMKDAGIPPEELLESEANILDFGCADGVFLEFLASKRIGNERLYGLDIGEDMVAVAIQKGFNCTFRTEDLFRKKFGLITLWDVIEHVPYPRDVARQIRELSEAGGRVLLQTPHFGELAVLMNSEFNHYLPVEHLHLFSRKALIDLFQAEGFRCVAQSSFGANAFEKHVAATHKSAYDKLAKKYDFGATQVLLFES